MKRILLATDLAPHSDRAMARAVQLCGQFGASLTALYAIRSGADKGMLDNLPPHHIEAEIRRHLDQVPGAAEIPVTTVAVRGPVEEAVADQAALIAADLLVVGHTGPSEGPFAITTVEKINVASPVPLLAVTARPFGRYAGALVAVDFTPASRASVLAAMALIPEGTLDLLHVCDLPGLDRTQPVSADTLSADFNRLLTGLPADHHLITRLALSGAPVPTILHTARASDQTQVIVMATTARSGVGRALLGSIAHDVVERAPADAPARDLLLVKDPGQT